MYWFMECCYDNEHLEVNVYMNLALRYVFPNWDTSRGSVSAFVKMVIRIILFRFNGDRLF